MSKINWRYAIGEIIIVIIGISIAFSLNNWKDSRAELILKKQYLANLALDLKAEITQIDSLQKICSRHIKISRELQPFVGKNRIKGDSAVLKVFELAKGVTFSPINTTYQALINSGDMRLIHELDLRRKIESHYGFHTQVQTDYKRKENIHENYLGEFFIRKMDYTALRRGDDSFLADPVLSNIITSLAGSMYLISDTNEKCLKSCKNLLAVVEQ